MRDFAGQHRAQRLQQRRRAAIAGNVVVEVEHLLARVALVAAEDLVAAVAGEQMRDALLCARAARRSRSALPRSCRTARRTRARSAETRDDVVGGDVVLRRLRAEVPVRDVGVLQLVVRLDAEADRECARRTRRDAAEHAGDRRAVEAAAQERAGRSVGRTAANGIGETRVQLVAQRARTTPDRARGSAATSSGALRACRARMSQRSPAGSLCTRSKIVSGAGIMCSIRKS